MVDLCETVLDLMLIADPVEGMAEGILLMRLICELDTVIRQHGVDFIGNGFDHTTQELLRRAGLRPDDGKPAFDPIQKIKVTMPPPKASARFNAKR